MFERDSLEMFIKQFGAEPHALDLTVVPCVEAFGQSLALVN